MSSLPTRISLSIVASIFLGCSGGLFSLRTKTTNTKGSTSPQEQEVPPGAFGGKSGGDASQNADRVIDGGSPVEVTAVNLTSYEIAKTCIATLDAACRQLLLSLLAVRGSAPPVSLTGDNAGVYEVTKAKWTYSGLLPGVICNETTPTGLKALCTMPAGNRGYFTDSNSAFTASVRLTLKGAPPREVISDAKVQDGPVTPGANFFRRITKAGIVLPQTPFGLDDIWTYLPSDLNFTNILYNGAPSFPITQITAEETCASLKSYSPTKDRNWHLPAWSQLIELISHGLSGLPLQQGDWIQQPFWSSTPTNVVGFEPLMVAAGVTGEPRALKRNEPAPVGFFCVSE